MHVTNLRKGDVVKTNSGAIGRMVRDYKRVKITRLESVAHPGVRVGVYTQALAFVQRGDEWHGITRERKKVGD